MGEPVEKCSGHLGIAEHGGPLTESEVGGDDDRGALVETADEMEEQLSASLSEGQIAQFVEDDEVEAGQVIRKPPLPAGARFGFEPVDQVDDIVEAATGATADAGPGDGNGKMAFAGAGAADEH